MIGLLLKHRYSEYGLLSYVDLEFAFSISIVAAYNVFYPKIRLINTDQQFGIFNLIIWTIGIILAVIVVKNISLGIGQDLFDGTIITFIQMRNRSTIFFILYFVDVLLLGLTFILISELVFYLAFFNPPLIWINNFLSEYLFICNLSYLIAILTKRPFRSFFISIAIILFLVSLELVKLIYIFNYFLPLDLILVYLAYKLFKRVSI